MKNFREEVSRLIQEEKGAQETAHFSSIDNEKEFLDSLNEDDKRWFDFTTEVQRNTQKNTIHHLSSEQLKEYKIKIEEFKRARDMVKGFRSVWYEFLANKLNIAAIKLSFLGIKRGKP
ncbi:MAG: hypothetical protein HZC04_00520 [Candidatus Lloydbacteria bacterium]|nr:hypothetical protein [Candidatus Lloydbacteria bacterium]